MREGKFSCGFQNGERWQMVNLRATTISEAKRERESLLAGLREGRVAAKDDTTFLRSPACTPAPRAMLREVSR